MIDGIGINRHDAKLIRKGGETGVVVKISPRLPLLVVAGGFPDFLIFHGFGHGD
jgi:hypothetical protein